jgi:CRISPR-associated exonuclease Cas4
MKFDELIDKIIEDFLDREERQRTVGTYFPSELPFCIRRTFFSYKQHKKNDLVSLKLFESGNIFHSWFKNVLFSGYISNLIKSFDYEGSLEFKTDGFAIRGRFDDVIVTEFDNNPILVEIKTMRTLNFIDGVKKHHLMQSNFYLSVMKLKKGFVIYIDRTNLQHKIFEVTQSDELFDEMVKRCKVLHKHLVENKVPFAEAKLNRNMRWNCDYCLYRLECMKEDMK